MNKAMLVLSLLISAPCAAVASESLSYSYAELGYVDTQVSRGGRDYDGWKVAGSVEITPKLHAFGGYAKQDFGYITLSFPMLPTSRFDLGDVQQARLGLGYRHALGARADLVASVAYEHLDYRMNYYGESFDGYSVEAGVRGTLTGRLQGHALAGYQGFEKFWGRDPHSRTYTRLGLQWKFSDHWSVAGDAKFDDEGTQEYFIGPRLSF